MLEIMLNVNPPNRGIELRFRAMEARFLFLLMLLHGYQEYICLRHI